MCETCESCERTTDYVNPAPESGNGKLWLLAGLAMTFTAAVHLYGKWLEPPKMYFPPAAVTIAVARQKYTYGPLNLEEGWTGDCLAIDGRLKLVLPNFDSPNCTAAKVRARYANLKN